MPKRRIRISEKKRNKKNSRSRCRTQIAFRYPQSSRARSEEKAWGKPDNRNRIEESISQYPSERERNWQLKILNDLHKTVAFFREFHRITESAMNFKMMSAVALGKIENSEKSNL